MATQTSQNDRIRDLVLDQYEEVWNKGNYAYAEETVHKDFADHPPTRFFDIGRTGPAALQQAAQEFRNGISDFHDDPELVLVEGDRVAYLGQISGKQDGEMFGFPPSDRRIERWGQFDVLTMMQQLGLAPGPPTPEASAERPGYGDPHRAGRESGTDIAANKAVYERMVNEIVNQGKFEVIPELFHPEYVDHAAPPGSPPGFAGIEAIFTMFRTGFPDVKFNIDQMVGEGSYVATLVHGEGTQTGEFVGIPPSNKHAVWRSVGFFRVEDGKIVEHWGIPDLLGLLIQIGVIPPPDAESAKGSVEAQA
jgi:predicted ester cyclase